MFNHIEIKKFEKIHHFRAWVQKSLPLVYDDSLTFLELLEKLMFRVNMLTDTVNEFIDIIDEFEKTINSFIDQMNEWQKQMNAWDERMKQIEELVAQWKTLIEQWTKMLEDWEKQFKDWEDKMDSWESKVESWETKISQWETEIKKWESQFETWSNTFQEWNSTFQNWNNTFQQWIQTMNEWSGKFEQWTNTFNNWENTWSQWQSTWAEWQQIITNIQEEIKKIGDRVTNVENIVNNWVSNPPWENITGVDVFENYSDFLNKVETKEFTPEKDKVIGIKNTNNNKSWLFIISDASDYTVMLSTNDVTVSGGNEIYLKATVNFAAASMFQIVDNKLTLNKSFHHFVVDVQNLTLDYETRISIETLELLYSVNLGTYPKVFKEILGNYSVSGNGLITFDRCEAVLRNCKISQNSNIDGCTLEDSVLVLSTSNLRASVRNCTVKNFTYSSVEGAILTFENCDLINFTLNSTSSYNVTLNLYNCILSSTANPLNVYKLVMKNCDTDRFVINAIEIEMYNCITRAVLQSTKTTIYKTNMNFDSGVTRNLGEVLIIDSVLTITTTGTIYIVSDNAILRNVKIERKQAAIVFRTNNGTGKILLDGCTINKDNNNVSYIFYIGNTATYKYDIVEIVNCNLDSLYTLTTKLFIKETKISGFIRTTNTLMQIYNSVLDQLGEAYDNSFTSDNIVIVNSILCNFYTTGNNTVKNSLSCYNSILAHTNADRLLFNVYTGSTQDVRCTQGTGVDIQFSVATPEPIANPQGWNGYTCSKITDTSIFNN